jgi:glycosyltransferase involved in cell wall biosynthesis
MFRQKNILLISPEPWNHIFVSKHHYAVHLAALGNNVFFLNPPTGTFKKERTKFQNLTSVFYPPFIKGLRFLPAFFRRYFIRKRYEEIERLCNTKFQVIWSFDNSVFFDFSALPADVFKICHIVDLNQNFQFQRAASTATLCIGVIEKIVSRLKECNQNTHLIPHGVASFPEVVQKRDLPGVKDRKAVYAGNLNMPHLDWEIYYQASRRFQEIDFLFVGSNRDKVTNSFFKLMEGCPNVHYISAVPSNELPHILASADLLFVAYQPQYYLQYASPHKLMEYIASGKPVVCTFSEGYEIDGLIYSAKNQTEWIEQLSFVISNLKDCSSDELTRLRKEFALARTYFKQIEKIEQIIEATAP